LDCEARYKGVDRVKSYLLYKYLYQLWSGTYQEARLNAVTGVHVVESGGDRKVAATISGLAKASQDTFSLVESFDGVPPSWGFTITPTTKDVFSFASGPFKIWWECQECSEANSSLLDEMPIDIGPPFVPPISPPPRPN
jgi:hypothetical protein